MMYKGPFGRGGYDYHRRDGGGTGAGAPIVLDCRKWQLDGGVVTKPLRVSAG